jgi:folate-binding protein YgfZ
MHIWDRMETNGSPVGTADWDLVNLVYGLPYLDQRLQGKEIAHLFNLDRLDAINFKKGCYPGQEVIARTQYRGKPTKRMVRLYSESELSLSVGDNTTLWYGENTQTSVLVVNVGKDLVKGTVVLAVISLKALEAAEGQFRLATGENVIIEGLGYTLESAN